MAAGVDIVRYTGASGATVNVITTLNTRANAEDVHTTAGTTNPIKIPASGTSYSYWVVTGLNVTTTPTGTINNIKWYTDGTEGFGTGVSCRVGTASTYSQATGVLGDTGNMLNSTSYTNLTSPVNAFTYTSSSPLSVTGSLNNPSTGAVGHYVVYQIDVATNASAGATNTETFTWQWDET